MVGKETAADVRVQGNGDGDLDNSRGKEDGEIADGLNVQGKRDASNKTPSLWRLVPFRGRRSNWGGAQKAVGSPGFGSWLCRR